MKIAYISCHDHEQYSVGYDDEESLLLAFLRGKGINIVRRVWDDTSVDWKEYGLIVLKSPWDYHEKFEAFGQWLDMLEAEKVRLLNPVETVRWNSNKRYLQDIAAADMDVIPSVFFEKGERPDLLPLFDILKTGELIVKPCISAGAKNIIHVTRQNVETTAEQVYELMTHEPYFAQPFMPEIYDGEWSCVFFNGTFSHSVLKLPGGGDFRVQHYHGGSIQPATPKDAHIKAATDYVTHFGKDTLYARVDGIITNDRFHLMELEFIEPYLYLDSHPEGYERYYLALSKHL